MTTSETYAGAVADTATVAADHGSDAGWILDYVTDKHYLEFKMLGKIELPRFEPIDIFGLSIDLSPTKYVVYMWIAAFIVFVMMLFIARSYRRSVVPRGFTNFIEVFILFIRDEIVRPNIGDKSDRYLPFLATIFFFIAVCNLLGLVPWGVSSTENINVTAGLAIVSFIMIQTAGMRSNGAFGYFKGLVPHGLPLFILPVMIVVEFLGLLTKPFALTVRLFANMTSGKIVILSLIGLIFFFKTIWIAPVSIVFTLFIMVLKMFIALLQAYIFTMLSALFIGMAVHQEH
jgi:F-type H+-transporting ATPase subunit a